MQTSVCVCLKKYLYFLSEYACMNIRCVSVCVCVKGVYVHKTNAGRLIADGGDTSIERTCDKVARGRHEQTTSQDFVSSLQSTYRPVKPKTSCHAHPRVPPDSTTTTTTTSCPEGRHPRCSPHDKRYLLHPPINAILPRHEIHP